MIAKRFIPVTVVPLLLLAGCESMSPTEKGVLGGGAIGAGTGAIVGHALHNTGAGALVGAGVGALSGGLIGNSVEKSEQRTQAQIAAAEARAQAQNQVGIADVIQMVHSHVDDALIISQIRSSGSVFHLSAQDVVMLKQNGVSDAVVQEMQATAYRAPRRVYTATPVYAPAYTSSVYVVEPAPPPPVVGVGFGYTRYRRW
jgi:surface antigen